MACPRRTYPALTFFLRRLGVLHQSSDLSPIVLSSETLVTDQLTVLSGCVGEVVECLHQESSGAAAAGRRIHSLDNIITDIGR